MQENKIEQKVRVGIVARADNGGLGIMALDFFRNIFVEKVMVTTAGYKTDYERFNGYEGVQQFIAKGGTPTLEEIKIFLKDLDVVVAFETPYNWNIFKMAKDMGIKTVLIPMYEWTEEILPEDPDLFLCPSELDYEVLPEPKKLINTPITREIIPFRERTEAKTFIFQNGHGGFMGRNSITEFMQALPLIKNQDIKFIVRSQVKFDPVIDKRVTYELEEKNYKDMWTEGDIYIHLHKFDGLSLPLNEAMAAGMPVIGLDVSPQNIFLPKELLIKPDAVGKVKIYREVDCAIISPVKIAEMIDKVASLPSEEIKRLSQISNLQAEKWSWKNLKPEFIKTLNELCGK